MFTNDTSSSSQKVWAILYYGRTIEEQNSLAWLSLFSEEFELAGLSGEPPSHPILYQVGVVKHSQIPLLS
jgi:hypothetical protein